MIVATVPTTRAKMAWQDHLTDIESYRKTVASGMAWVLFEDFPSFEEFEEWLDNKEKEVVTD